MRDIKPLQWLTALVALCALAGFGSPALAVSASPSGPGTQGQTYDFDSQSGEWFVGLPTAPIEVNAEPGAGPWFKTLQDPVPGTIVPQSTTFTVHEHLVVGPGSLDWTDWHEEILPDASGLQQWEWLSGLLQVNGVDAAAGDLGPQLDLGSPLIWFDPLVPVARPGDTVDIWKEIHCGNPNGCQGPIVVAEFPTFVPVPAAVWLLGSALIGLLGVARRRRAA